MQGKGLRGVAQENQIFDQPLLPVSLYLCLSKRADPSRLAGDQFGLKERNNAQLGLCKVYPLHPQATIPSLGDIYKPPAGIGSEKSSTS